MNVLSLNDFYLTENYAGVFICKEGEDVHYQTISFWSRQKALSDEATVILNKVLTEHEAIDVSYMKAVNHENCEIAV